MGLRQTAFKKFLPTPSARRATGLPPLTPTRIIISTHALREEGDVLLDKLRHHNGYFYPRPPRGGRRGVLPRLTFGLGQFLPTPSARRATAAVAVMDVAVCPIFLPTPSARRATAVPIEDVDKYGAISTHALREEGDSVGTQNNKQAAISTHALREEGDKIQSNSLPNCRNFYPRPPRGGRRDGNHCIMGRRMDFYPRPPRGGRLNPDGYCDGFKPFLPTPSARRATRLKAE